MSKDVFEFLVLFDREEYEPLFQEKLEEFLIEYADVSTDWVSFYAPVDTGALQESFYNEVNIRDYYFHVKSDLPYAWKQDEYYGYVKEGFDETEREIDEIFDRVMG